MDDSVGRAFQRKAGAWDDIYSGEGGFLRAAWNRATRGNLRRRHEFALSALGPVEGRHVLDAGCGSGRSSVDFASRGARVTGVDVAPAMLDLARALAQERGVADRCEFVAEGVLDHRPDEPYAGSLALGLFDYLEQPVETLAHLADITAGPVVVSFPSAWGLRVPARALWWRLHGVRVRFMTRAAVHRLCAEAGVAVQRLESTWSGGPLQMLVARGRAG